MDHLLKTKKEFKNLKKQETQKYIYRNELDTDFKDIAKRTASDKALRDKVFNITKDPKYDGLERGLATVVYKFFNKKIRG